MILKALSMRYKGETKGMAHCKKFTRAACGHMFKHYERAKDENGEYIKFSNENIDTNKSGLNYNLAPKQSQGGFVKRRCSEVKMQNRADVNVICSWVVTAPKEIKAEETEKFFREAYKFLSERYGKENVVSAYVHMDEITPHMHFTFVPVVLDKKKNIYKVSAKEAVTRKDLQTFHKDLSACMEKAFGRDIGILNEATKEGDRSVKELKRGTASEQLKLIEKNIIVGKEEELKIKSDISELQFEKAEIEKEISGRKVEISIIDRIKPKPVLLGRGVKIEDATVEDIEYLKQSAYKNYENEKELHKQMRTIGEKNRDLQSFKSSDWELRNINANLQMEVRKLEESLGAYKYRAYLMKSAMESLLEEIKEYIEQYMINQQEEDEREQNQAYDDWER
jgi:hypothetical protein